MSELARITFHGAFTAQHVCAESQPHTHTWEVAATKLIRARTDCRNHLAGLDRLLAAWEGTLLPPDREWMEDIARVIYERLNCVRVVVSRPDARMSVEWPAC